MQISTTNILNSLANYGYTKLGQKMYPNPNVSLDYLDKPKILWESNEKPDKGFKLLSTVAPNGAHPWFYLKNAAAKNSVMIIPIMEKDGKDHIVFIRQLRPPVYAERKAPDSIEIPAGYVGDVDSAESLKDAIEREIAEEIGYKVLDYKIIAKNISNAANVTGETLNYAVVRIDANQKVEVDDNNPDKGDNGAIISKHIIPIDNIQNWLREQSEIGASIDSNTCAALYHLAPEYPELIAFNPKSDKTGSRLDYVA